MDRDSRPVRAAWAVGLALLLLVVGAVPARAAFPGANGLLVVQPASGRGLLLVGADGGHPRQICTVRPRCDPATDPVWSPDGSEIAFTSPQGSGLSVIYPDGSCLACVASTLVDPYFGAGFLPDGRLAVQVDANYPPPELGAMNVDGMGFQPFKFSGFRPVNFWLSLYQPAWSPTGQLAAVQSVQGKPEVLAIDPLTGSARQLTRDGASLPSWSPDGRRLAVVHRGWIELIESRGGRMRRLTRGGAPAWAPDGRQLAFVGAHDRLFVIAARGGTPRPVGHIRGVRVDWQPVPREPTPPCQGPAGSSVLATTPDATITIDPATMPPPLPPVFSVLGCLTSTGHERVLESRSNSENDQPSVGLVAVAGDYAALVNEDANSHYCCGHASSVAVFDLRTGAAVAGRGGESASCGPGGCGIDQLVVGSDAVTATHTFATTPNCVFDTTLVCTATTVEQIVANDSTGTHILDSATYGGSYGLPILSQLALSGNTLTWSHAGNPESAQLN